MPNSLRCMISKLKFQGKISELECEELFRKLDNHDKELIKEHTAEWRIAGKTTLHYECSKCGGAGDKWDKFCKNCGADMRKESEDKNE